MAQTERRVGKQGNASVKRQGLGPLVAVAVRACMVWVVEGVLRPVCSMPVPLARCYPAGPRQLGAVFDLRQAD